MTRYVCRCAARPARRAATHAASVLATVAPRLGCRLRTATTGPARSQRPSHVGTSRAAPSDAVLVSDPRPSRSMLRPTARLLPREVWTAWCVCGTSLSARASRYAHSFRLDPAHDSRVLRLADARGRGQCRGRLCPLHAQRPLPARLHARLQAAAVGLGLVADCQGTHSRISAPPLTPLTASSPPQTYASHVNEKFSIPALFLESQQTVVTGSQDGRVVACDIQSREVRGACAGAAILVY